MTWKEYTALYSDELKTANALIQSARFAKAETILHAKLLDLENTVATPSGVTPSDATRREQAYANQLLGYAAILQGRFDEAIQFYSLSLELSLHLDHGYIRASSSGGLGNCYHRQGRNDRALELLGSALQCWEDLGEEYGVATECGNMANVLMNLRDFALAREYMERAVRIFEHLGEVHQMATSYGNLGVCLQNLQDFDAAYDAMIKSVDLSRQLDDKAAVARVEGNIGTLCYHMGRAREAAEHMRSALITQEALGNRPSIAIWKSNLGWIYGQPSFDDYDPLRAEQLIRDAIEINTELGATFHLANNYESLAEVLEHSSQLGAALEAYKRYHALSQEYQSQRARELAERQDAEFKLGMEKARVQATEQVLHRVLPASIAERLTKGEEVADHFESVSVLFSDIVGFTPMASRMSAHNVILLLNHLFEILDSIMEKHGCEKIKTIGDGYMAIAGAPIPTDDHAERLAAAAMEMVDALHLPPEIQSLLPEGSLLQLRIGLHCGPAFAGIVGRNRFVYDLYSDTINTAARMESHGAAGKIHCSDDFVQALRMRGSELVFEDRGISEIKGKGPMRTFFLHS